MYDNLELHPMSMVDPWKLFHCEFQLNHQDEFRNHLISIHHLKDIFH